MGLYLRHLDKSLSGCGWGLSGCVIEGKDNGRQDLIRENLGSTRGT